MEPEIWEEDQHHHLHHPRHHHEDCQGQWDQWDWQALKAPQAPPPAGAALLAQLVAAMQTAAAGLLAPGPGPALPPPRVKISPPIFKGLPGERPEAHLLRANDWMDTYNILLVNKPANFKHTLDHLAREWYNSLMFPIAWNDLQQRFSRYFSTQGRSIKHLYDKW